MKRLRNRWTSILAVSAAALVLPAMIADHADAQRGRGARTAVHRSGGGGRAREVNVHHTDVNVHAHGGYHGGYHGYHGHYHPVARGVAATAAIATTAAVTAAVVGTVVATLPPSCSTIVVEGVTYQQCGSDYYQPQYVVTDVQYVVVESPED